MKHLITVSKVPAVATTTAATGSMPKLILLNGVISIVDELLLAQRQSPWKVSFGGDTTTDTTSTT